ncbi:DUF3416 domain-containing protein, partial [Clavibacter michiganensis subsp. insidiosus]
AEPPQPAEPTPAVDSSSSTPPTPAAEPASDDHVPVIGRIPILSLTPQIEDDLWPAKSFVHDVVPFGATIFREGHDLIGADVLLTDPTGLVTAHRMTLDASKPGLD